MSVIAEKIFHEPTLRGIKYGDYDPSTVGTNAPIDELFIQAGGIPWIKTGAGDTAWTRIATGAGGGGGGSYLPLSGGSLDAGASLTVPNVLSVGSYLNVTATNGLAIGNVGGRRRIQYGTDAATAFSLVTDANGFASLYAYQLISSGGIIVPSAPAWSSASWAQSVSIPNGGAIVFGYDYAAGGSRYSFGMSSGSFYLGRAPGNTAGDAISYLGIWTATDHQSNVHETFTAAIRQTGGYIVRIENVASSAPPGSTGPGLELGVTGGVPYVQAYNRTTAAYVQMNLYGSSFVFAPFGTPVATIGSSGITASNFILA